MLILFQGDSITDGGRDRNGDPATIMGQNYTYILSAVIGYRYPHKGHEFVNRGVGGNICAQLCGRWQQDALNLRPDLISILIGTNDARWESISDENLVPHGMLPFYELLLKQTKQILPKTKLVILEPFVLDCGNLEHARFKRYQEYLYDYQKGIKNLAESYNAFFIPLQERFNHAAKEISPQYWLRDSIHPTPAGHALIAEAWMDAVGHLL